MAVRKLMEEIEDQIYIIYGEKPSGHSYLLKGLFKNVLIDTGTKGNFPRIKKAVEDVGLNTSDIQLVLCTHEHYDHIGGIGYFYEHSLIAADRFAATKIELQDEYVIHAAVHGEDEVQTRVNIWLEHKMLFDFGNYKLKVLTSPGHTSGSICFYEPFRHFLFAGDTVFSGGTISKISDSGSYGDYINSLERLSTYRINRIFPGHGKICEDAEETIQKSIFNARNKLKQYNHSLRDKGE